MNLSFDGAVAFEVPVMFANSRNVAFEKAETGKRGSRLSYTPTMLIPKPETTSLLILGIFPKNDGLTVESALTIAPNKAVDRAFDLC